MRAAIALLLLAACASRPATPPPSLADELLAMKDADQEVRKRGLADQSNPAIGAEMKALSEKQVARLRDIIHKYGWRG
jgi:hypothetical protein